MNGQNASWYSKPGSGGQGLVIDENDGRTVAVAYDEKDRELLAAAPELLSALIGLMEAWTPETGQRFERLCGTTRVNLARAAIARATGQA